MEIVMNRNIFLFNQFIIDEEVSTTRRQGIKHFQQMDPVEFVNWMKSVKNETKGILKNIKAVMKIDRNWI